MKALPVIQKQIFLSQQQILKYSMNIQISDVRLSHRFILHPLQTYKICASQSMSVIDYVYIQELFNWGGNSVLFELLPLKVMQLLLLLQASLKFN